MYIPTYTYPVFKKFKSFLNNNFKSYSQKEMFDDAMHYWLRNTHDMIYINNTWQMRLPKPSIAISSVGGVYGFRKIIINNFKLGY